jgi:hypothetical protein
MAGEECFLVADAAAVAAAAPSESNIPRASLWHNHWKKKEEGKKGPQNKKRRSEGKVRNILNIIRYISNTIFTSSRGGYI